jgi:hypothetical protein
MTDSNDMSQSSDDERVIATTGRMLRDAIPTSNFDAGFTGRAMARLAAARAATPPELLRFSAMQRSFRVLAAAAAVAIVALGVNNTVIARNANTSIVDAAIGLQPVSAESVLSYTSESLQ